MSFLSQYHFLLEKTRAAVIDALEHEAAAEVKDIMEEQTQLQVYSYEASAMAMATRRVDGGGLGDRRNMVSEVVRTARISPSGHWDYELTVENTAPFQFPASGDAALSDVVEKGLSSYCQPGPRPFVAGTQEQAISTGRAYRALKDGLKRHGL